MKTTLWPTLALSFVAALGNGQDGALVTTPPPDGWGIQGNAAWTKAQREADLERATLAARQKKALMESMASVAHQPPTITSAEQFLSVHRPPARPPGEAAPAPSPVRRDTYVPQFENVTPRAGRGGGSPSVAPPPASARPEKRGLLGLFKPKEKGGDSGPSEPALPPAAAYPEPSTSMPPSPPVVDPSAQQAALASATQGGAAREKPSFLGRLFGKGKGTEPSLSPDSTLSAPPQAPIPPAPPVPGASEPVGMPSPPSYPASVAPVPAPTPPAGGGSSIFVNRPSIPATGLTVNVLSATQATVDGVLVRLHEGSRVTVLERSGSQARVRLPDGREGTVEVGVLGR